MKQACYAKGNNAALEDSWPCCPRNCLSMLNVQVCEESWSGHLKYMPHLPAPFVKFSPPFYSVMIPKLCTLICLESRSHEHSPHETAYLKLGAFFWGEACFLGELGTHTIGRGDPITAGVGQHPNFCRKLIPPLPTCRAGLSCWPTLWSANHASFLKKGVTLSSFSQKHKKRSKFTMGGSAINQKWYKERRNVS